MPDPAIHNPILKLIEQYPVIFGGGFAILSVLIGALFKEKVKEFYLKLTQKNKLKQTVSATDSNAIIQQNTGRVIINNYYSPTVGVIEEGVPALQEIPSESIPDIISIGLLKVPTPSTAPAFSDKDIEFIGKYFNQVFETIGSSRNGLTMLEGAIFALGSKDFENKEWKEHCAASFRELLHHWKGVPGSISAGFNLTFKEKNPDFPTMTTNPEPYQKLESYYAYFSGKCHHSSTTIYSLRKLYGQEIKGGDDSEEMFFRVVGDFLSDLGNFFSAYVK